MLFFPKAKKVTSFLLCAALLLGVLAVIPMNAHAMEGAGTEESPYIVNTPEDLNNIRNNLSAHYILGNTIDASSLGNFRPIGTLARPFTGSFTCETDENGMPLYAIKNLKVYNDAGEKYGHTIGSSASYSDYSEKNSRWEAALFGASDGATFEGIYILDADITNTVVGQHQQNADSTWNPGMDEMNAAILVGQADNTYISGCGVTGIINAKSNHIGGIVGSANNSTIDGCFSVITVKASGLWCHGALAGDCEGSMISRCYAKGDITTPASCAGLFIGSFGGGTMVSDCYAEGNISTGTDFIGRCQETISSVTGCYSSGTVTTPKGDSFLCAIEDCYSVNFSQFGFTKASADQIAQTFGTRQNWKLEEGKAVIDGLNVVTDASVFVIGEGTKPSGGQSTTQPSGTTPATDVASLVALIEALPEPEAVTLENKADIMKAKAQFDKLTDAQFDEMPNTASVKLNNAVGAVSLLMVSELANSIKALPEADQLDASYKETVESLVADLNFLSEEYQSVVAQKLRDKLAAAQEAISKLEDAPAGSELVDRPLTTTELVVCIVLVVLIAAVLVLNVVMCIYIIKNTKKAKRIPVEGVGDKQ